MHETARHLQTCAALSALTPAQLSFLVERCRLQLNPRGSYVYQTLDEPRDVYLLVSGQVRIAHVNEDGKQSILAWLLPGLLFGELAICHTGPREECCEAIHDSTVVVIPASDLRQIIRDNADLSFDMISLFGVRRQKIECRLKSTFFRSNRQRLVQMLLELAEDYGIPESNGIRISLGLSHQELGSLIGASRETVTIILGQLRNEHLLNINRREIVITQLDFLQ